ncbi:hypothetical protein SK128_014755 [Halocaridina rubra]|uniref:Phosphatidylinositol-glycan biosynthesis class F protein n=1 Tax=Halocaridina rubra TaxID=373956 RepID=A0AAN8XFU2_HALRR
MITPRGAWSSVPYFTKYISSLVLGIGILVYLNHSEYRLEACLPALRIYSLLAIVLQVGLLFLKKAANEESIGISSSRKAKNKSYKVSDVFLIFLLSLCCVCGVHIVAVLYGAYIVENFEATLTFSIVVASLALVRPLICLGPRALQILLERLNWEEDLDLQTIAIFVGAWLGALPIPLDWDRPWQAWPLTCCIGAIFGELATSGYFLIKSFIIDPIKWKNKSK